MTKTKIPTLKSLLDSHKFDWVNNDITDKLFPPPQSLRTDFKLYHFNRYISSEDAVAEMAKDGYAPANVYELLSWKNWNDKDCVVALGSVGEVGGGRIVPCLGEGGLRRYLVLYRWSVVWHSRDRFLAVRNLQEAIALTEAEK